ncbi:MAG: TlpA family protein disulfide reductase [Chloroflexi bacterium]|nr:TlpA family protein disulfide reductase [Chloroflexota bacterium]
MKRILQMILPLMVGAGLLLAGCSNEASPPPASQPPASTPDETSAPEIGNLAPDFQLQTLDGQTFSLSGVRGKPVLLNFWATWCGPCRFEMPFLQEIYDEYSNKGLVVIAVDIGESKSDVENFMQREGLTLPALLDSQTEVAKLYRVAAIPTTFFIDKDGIIRGRQIGAFTDKAAIEKGLKKIMP